ncbi:GNAT family N-acetyltransferase [Paenibacillus chitinolyticus]|uniref:GNAT family N-acetyltransferase n=1 Tax=Paenibacillus chitinolyticus TaxID=79263 RepID=UPI003D059A01
MDIRLVNQEEMREAAALADSIFRDSEQISMAEGFPFLFSALHSQSVGAFENGRLVAFMGLLPSVIRIGPARLTVFSLGSVCTHPESRGKGIAGELFAAVRGQVARSGGSLLLVSGGRSLYTRAGCRPFGSLRRYALGGAAALQTDESAGGYRLRPYERGDLPAMSRLAAARRSAFEQSPWDLGTLIDASAYAACLKLRHETWIAEKDGEPAAFIVAAVPDPAVASTRFPRLIEWAGAPEAAARLLTGLTAKLELAEFQAAVPFYETGLHEALRSFPSEESRNEGTLLVTDAPLLLRQLRPYLDEQSRSRLGERLGVRETGEGGVRLTLPGLPDLLLSVDDWMALLFNPDAAVRIVPARWQEELKSVFPLPFPYTAGLNYI